MHARERTHASIEIHQIYPHRIPRRNGPDMTCRHTHAHTCKCTCACTHPSTKHAYLASDTLGNTLTSRRDATWRVPEGTLGALMIHLSGGRHLEGHCCWQLQAVWRQDADHDLVGVASINTSHPLHHSQPRCCQKTHRHQPQRYTAHNQCFLHMQATIASMHTPTGACPLSPSPPPPRPPQPFSPRLDCIRTTSTLEIYRASTAARRR
jgi:hypothetical protein